MRIIAADSSGNERAIDLVLNPEAVFEVEQDESQHAKNAVRLGKSAERRARLNVKLALKPVRIVTLSVLENAHSESFLVTIRRSACFPMDASALLTD